MASQKTNPKVRDLQSYRMRQNMNLKKALISLCLIACLCSCTTKMAYNYLDWAIQWKARSLVPLNKAQKRQTKLASIAFHDWHQSTQLPEYANYLRSLANRLQKGPISAKEIHAETDKVQLLLDQSINQVIPDVIEVLGSLDDEQVTELLSNYRKERKDYEKKYVKISAQEQVDKRYEDLVDYLKPWFGSPNKTQKNLIRQWSKQLKPYESLNAQQQKIWELELEVILKNRNNKNQLQAGLKKLLYFRTDDWDPELEAILDYNQDLTYELLSTLTNSASKKQKNKLFNKLEDYIKICSELAEEKRKENDRKSD